MSFFSRVCVCFVYAPLSLLFSKSPSPALAVTFTPSSTLSAGTSIDPFVTLTSGWFPSTFHSPSSPFLTTTFSPSFNGISIRSPPLSLSGVTFKFPFCHCPTVGAVGFSSLTATYTLTWFPSLPWLSTAARVTSYSPAGVAFPGVCFNPDTIFTVVVPYGFSLSVALPSSASVTVTKSFNKSAVNVVPES